MLVEPNRIHISGESELGRLLDAVGEMPVILERDGKLYRLSEETNDDIWAGYDPEKARAALSQAAGSWADVDTDALIDDIYAARETGSRPSTRP